MNLTLNKVTHYGFHGQYSNGKSGISKLAKFQGKSDFNDESEFNLMDVLKSNGIEDAIWCLQCFNYSDSCLFVADVAESVLHMVDDKKYRERLKLAVQGVRNCKNSIDSVYLNKLAKYDEATANGYVPCFAATATEDAVVAAINGLPNDVASYSVDAVIYKTSSNSYASAAGVGISYALQSARKNKWSEIERLFIKHFES